MSSSHPRPGRLRAFLHSCFAWDRPFVRTVFFLALPMVFQDLVAASLHIIDGLMVSQLGDAAYSAVMQANRFTFVFQLLIFGTASGSSIFFSQFWGSRDIVRMRHAMGIALFSAVLLSLIFSLAGLLFPAQIISLFLPPGESFNLAVSYLRIVAPGYLLMAISNIYAMCMKSTEMTHLPMIAGISGIVTNTVLNYALIYGKLGFPQMGVTGAAVATVTAAGVTLLINLCFAYGKHLPAGASLREFFCRDILFIRRFIRTVCPVIFNEGLWAVGTTMYSVFYGRMGDVNVAAVGVCTTINDLVWVVLFAMTSAAAIIVGKTLGQGERDRAYLYAKRLMAGGFVAGLVMGLVLLGVRIPLTGLFSGLSPLAREKAQLLLVIAAAGLAIRTSNCINVVGVLRSGGATLYSLVLDAGTLWVAGVPLTGLAALVFGWPIEWVYCCTLADEVLKFIIGLPLFRTKKWMRVLTTPTEEENLEHA